MSSRTRGAAPDSECGKTSIWKYFESDLAKQRAPEALAKHRDASVATANFNSQVFGCGVCCGLDLLGILDEYHDEEFDMFLQGVHRENGKENAW